MGGVRRGSIRLKHASRAKRSGRMRGGRSGRTSTRASTTVAAATVAGPVKPMRFKFNCNPGGLTFSQITKFYSKVYDIPIAKANTLHFGVSSGFVVKRGYRLLLNIGDWTFRVVQIDDNGIVLEGRKRQPRRGAGRGKRGFSPKLKRWFRSRSVMEWLNSNHIPRKRLRALTGSHTALTTRPVGARYWDVEPRVNTGLIGGRLPPTAGARTHSAPAGASTVPTSWRGTSAGSSRAYACNSGRMSASGSRVGMTLRKW